jgi:hypothetical protein
MSLAAQHDNQLWPEIELLTEQPCYHDPRVSEDFVTKKWRLNYPMTGSKCEKNAIATPAKAHKALNLRSAISLSNIYNTLLRPAFDSMFLLSKICLLKGGTCSVLTANGARNVFESDS